MEEGKTIDYTPYLQSIEDRLSDMQGNISDDQAAIQREITEIKAEIQNLRTESFFGNEDMDIFVPYANTSDIANLLFAIVIMLGMIFGALVFRHFRK